MANKKKRKKKPRGKQKGNSFERDVKKMILNAFAPFGISTNDAFRSILSGGHVESAGDISISSGLAKLYPFATECKFYKKVDLYCLFKPWDKIGKLRLWWEQTIVGADKTKGLYPLLVFKSNNKEVLCMMYSHTLYNSLGLTKNPLKKRKEATFRPISPDGELYIFRFSVLLKLLVKKAKTSNANSATKTNSTFMEKQSIPRKSFKRHKE